MPFLCTNLFQKRGHYLRGTLFKGGHYLRKYSRFAFPLGSLIWKGLLGVFNSSKKQTKRINLMYDSNRPKFPNWVGLTATFIKDFNFSVTSFNLLLCMILLKLRKTLFEFWITVMPICIEGGKFS